MNAPPRWGAGLQMLTQAIFLHFFVSFEKRGRGAWKLCSCMPNYLDFNYIPWKLAFVVFCTQEFCTTRFLLSTKCLCWKGSAGHKLTVAASHWLPPHQHTSAACAVTWSEEEWESLPLQTLASVLNPKCLQCVYPDLTHIFSLRWNCCTQLVCYHPHIKSSN